MKTRQISAIVVLLRKKKDYTAMIKFKTRGRNERVTGIKKIK